MITYVSLAARLLYIRPELRNKLDAKSIKGLFMGYGEDGEMGYRIWIPQLKKVIRSQDVVFNETRLLQKMTIKGLNFSMTSHLLDPVLTIRK